MFLTNELHWALQSEQHVVLLKDDTSPVELMRGIFRLQDVKEVGPRRSRIPVRACFMLHAIFFPVPLPARGGALDSIEGGSIFSGYSPRSQP